MRVSPRGRAAHRAMMLNPDRWPAWPHLPIKHPRKMQEAGLDAGLAVLVETEGHDPVKGVVAVVYGNMLMLPATPPNLVSVDALLDDGWEVD